MNMIRFGAGPPGTFFTALLLALQLQLVCLTLVA
jgi:hypothetical protein